MIEDIPHLIGAALQRFALIRVSDMKEKYGTYRVYVSFGLHGLHDVLYPRHRYMQFPKSLYCLAYGPEWLFGFINRVLIPYQHLVYKHVYQYYIRKYPLERRAIVYGMDYADLIDPKYREDFSCDL